MALIKCPNCGAEVSDKAERCPNCNTEIGKKEDVKVCEECGTELEDGVKVCPKCGCPVPESEEEKRKKKSKKIAKFVVAGVAIVAVIIAIVVGIIVTNQKKEEAAKAAEEEARIQASEDYAGNLQLASFTMLTGASTAEEAGNLIHDVWYDTIFDEHNEDTSKYTSGHTDFNDSLKELFSDEEFQTKIQSIESNQDTVKELMQELQNPPEEHEEAYATLKEYYDAYLELTNLVVNPTGSLQSFTESFNDADTEVVKCYNAMDTYLE